METNFDVALNQGSLIFRKRSGFEEDSIRNAKLADVVQIGAADESGFVLVGPTDGSRDFERVTANALRVSGCLTIAQVNCRAQSLQSFLVALFDALQRRPQLFCAQANQVFQVVSIA